MFCQRTSEWRGCDLLAVACLLAFGFSRAMGQTAGDPTGACCYCDGCVIVTESDCGGLLYGEYLGDDSVCTAFCTEEIYMPDPALRAAVQEQLGGCLLSESNMMHLTHLDADWMGITCLTGLEHAQNLEVLSLRYDQVTDISPLAGLTNLIDLDLYYNQITDISPLAGLASLAVLQLDHNQITDISPLAGLVSLTHLYMNDNPIQDLSSLAGLTGLQWLWIGDTSTTDLTPLAGLVNLQSLDISCNPITDISPLGGLVNITDLQLWQTPVTDMSPLAGLANLADLDASGTPISDISPLAGLACLTYLIMDYCQIVDISPLAGLASLSDLDLSDNQIRDIAPLAGLMQLADVDLHENPLNSEAYCVWIPVIIDNNPGITFMFDAYWCPDDPDVSTWNAPPAAHEVMFCNNCYNYATNRVTMTYAQPGWASGIEFDTPVCGILQEAVIADGLCELAHPDECPDWTCLVALVVAPGPPINPQADYHWYRWNEDGTWSHKPGRTQVTTLDFSGNIITNPETADRRMKWPGGAVTPGYTDFCGYFSVTLPAVVAGQGCWPAGAAAFDGVRSTLSILSGVYDPSWEFTDPTEVEEILVMIEAGTPTDPPDDEGVLGFHGFYLNGDPDFPDFPELVRVLDGVIQIVDDGAVQYLTDPQGLEQLLVDRAYEEGLGEFFVCPGDFDLDGDVDTADLLFLLGAWGTPDGDVDGDGDTDTADLLALLGAWGECP